MDNIMNKNECYMDLIVQANEPTHDKMYNKTCITVIALVQPVHPASMSKVLVYCSMDSAETLITLYGCEG